MIYIYIVPADSTHFNNHGSVAPFTSQYLAHHLQDESDPQLPGADTADGDTQVATATTPASNVMLAPGGQNSTRNLANLSRMFRQLRPHLLQNVSSHMKSSKKQLTVRVHMYTYPLLWYVKYMYTCGINQ